MKKCSKCKQVLPEESFNKSSAQKSGLRCECRQCQSDMNKGYPGPAKKRSQSKTRYLKMRVNGVNIPVHRHVMETMIGRPLLENEVVHHINGDKHDNRPENLTILLVNDHSRLENKGRKHTEETRKKVSETLKGNQRRKGIPHTKETSEILSKLLIGNQRRKGKSPSNKGKKLGADGHFH